MQIDRFSPLVAAAVLALFAAAPALGETDAATLATQRCAVCHGARGESSNEQFPQLAGQNARYLSKQLQDFASGARTHVAMNVIARVLSGEQIEALAQHYERLKPQAHPGTDPLLANVGRYIWERGNPYTRVPACTSCHKEAGLGNAHLPRLAGQNPRYVMNQLQRFHARERQNDAGPMAYVTSGLSELEMRAVAEYIGGLGRH